MADVFVSATAHEGAAAATARMAATWPLPMHDFSWAERTLAVACFAALYTVFYMVGRSFYPRERTREKAWLLTTLSSTGTSIIGVFYAVFLVTHGTDMFFAQDDVSKLGIMFFIVYLALDLLYGYFEYPDQMNFLSGYFHHTFYIALLLWIWHHQLLVAFMVFLPCEIPTAIMCYGQLNKAWRQDWAFGISFFLIRIVYMVFMVVELYRAQIWFWMAGVFILSLHCYWFSRWVISQRQKGVIRALEERYASQINRLKTHSHNARNFFKRTMSMRKRLE